MWQLYGLASLTLAAVENVIDKLALVRDRFVDSGVASFWRAFVFFLGIVAIGYIASPHHLTFLFHWGILAFAAAGAGSSLCYTYLLREVEVTSIGAAAYLAPFFFLLVDIGFVHIHLTRIQIAGVTLLMLGGIGFVVDGRSHKLKSEITWAVGGVFLFNVLYTGGEAYLFKYLNLTYNLNGMSFFASLWFISVLILLLIVVLRGKLGLLLGRGARTYIPQILASKLCDSLSSVLWTGALAIATVSQISALEAFFPLVLFIIAVVVQKKFSLSLRENLRGRHHFFWKGVAVALLLLGGLLVR